ncbi:MAG: ABC transporter ATP-binding protein, partial [Oscillospiraceae bacterium]|nr:ABC transporter ATP-binding protein [Oscillospiraceae bacterium]
MPPVRMRGDGRKAKDPKKTMLRLLSYMKPYLPRLIGMVACIVLATCATVASNGSLKSLVDDYVAPMLAQGTPDFAPLIRFLCMMAGIYLAGLIASFLQQWLMVPVGQGTQKTIRDQLFTHMQRLPVRYFDTHPVGDLMSRYTSDIDTLRQMISQAIPQCISSAITIVVVFFAMLFTSPILTVVVILSLIGVLYITKTVAGRSARFFIGQQKALGSVNSFVEEMVSGQRVVKVFCHEDTCKEEFDRRNDELRANAFKAGAFSNMMGPVNNNLSYIQYSIIAIVGSLLIIASKGSLLSTGSLLSFLLFSRTFNQPIGHISNQINAIVMALAGAERIFEVMDEVPEEDQGYVTLVNAHIGDDGTVTESEKRTGQWAWKHPHGDGTLTYTPLRGDITMFNVDFGYVPEKTVLHDVTLYAH